MLSVETERRERDRKVSAIVAALGCCKAMGVYSFAFGSDALLPQFLSELSA
jgi:hypothetical protein